ncbi:hypothetical protein ACF061_25130 [Streptomyces sp. NPDC015220]|uniref:hypothetical protein n=1 Tax=Streptomyces sp. NPDC015220 TaxID=3364947 RepID=UPI0036FA8299
MTVPEENRPGTDTADETTADRWQSSPKDRGATGRTLREALQEARIRPDDFEEK